jgi:hypothetical protein
MILRRAPGTGDFNVSETHDEVSPIVIETSATWNVRMSNPEAAVADQVLRATTAVRFHFGCYNFNNDADQFRTRNFAVEVEWSDVLIAIERFAAHGNQQAVCLQAVLNAIAAAKDT